MKILQTRRFERAAKKLHKNQRKDLETAIAAIIDDPAIGQEKIGDLQNIRVYKFKMTGNLTLLAYSYEQSTMILTLLTLGSHENFYRDLKR